MKLYNNQLHILHETSVKAYERIPRRKIITIAGGELEMGRIYDFDNDFSSWKSGGKKTANSI